MTPTTSKVASLKKDYIVKVRLPHPHLSTYYLLPVQDDALMNDRWLRLKPDHDSLSIDIPQELRFTALNLSPNASSPPASDNTRWAISQRSPAVKLQWSKLKAITSAQVWLVVYALLLSRPETEQFRLSLDGHGSQQLSAELIASMLCHEHPAPLNKESTFETDEIIVSRSAFWQGAGSPFGTRSAWTPSSRDTLNVEPADYIITTEFPSTRVHQRHPRRPAKPEPGSVVYSRYVPSLDEHFSLIALDYKNPEHLNLFHTWQNDPRVAKGWNEPGDLEYHRSYLRKMHEDPHMVTVLARFDDTPFAYFELYYAKEDHLGAYYNAGDHDRGRHTLVGDSRFRGPHRVLSWWSCIIHYLFLDDHRCANVVGEPNAANNTVLVYDLLHGLNVESYIDFPHKRAVLVKVSREWFFQICPLYQKGGFIAGTGVPLPARL